MSKYTLRTCRECMREKRCRLNDLCDPCYRKIRHREATTPCTLCQKLRPLVKGVCHTCYERQRRAEIKDRAKADPKIIERERIKAENRYLKSRAKGYYTSISRRLSSIIHSLKSRDPQCTITKRWILENLINGSCYYCGMSEFEAVTYTGKRLGIDRRDSDLGYNQENCVPACHICNTMKFNFWTDDEMLTIARVVRDLLQRKGVFSS